MVDREVVERRLGRLETLLVDLEAVAARPRPEFLSNRGLQAQAERWTHLAVETCIDLANHLIADRGWESPQTYRDTFQVLQSRGVLESKLAEQMAGWAGLRNVLVHLYMDVDHERLHQILAEELDDLRRFARALNEAIEDR